MHIISIINYKGGVGKTSVTANLAAELAWRGYRILMVDMDPQGSLTFSFIRPEDWEKSFADNKTIKSWYDALQAGTSAPLRDLIYTPRRSKVALKGNGQLDIICSHLGLINVDLELATLLSGANIRQAKQNFIRVHRRLADGLSQLGQSDYDAVLIDCPPNFNIVTKTAIVASDFILVPTRPDFLSTLGIDYLLRNVRSLVADYNDYAGVAEGTPTQPIQPATLGVLFNMIQERLGPITAQQQYMQQVRTRSGLYVFEHYIKRNDTLFASAPESGVPVVLNGYGSGTYKNVVDGLEEVTTEFASKVGIKRVA